MQKQFIILKYPQDLSACIKIRNTVFVQEQKFDAAIEYELLAQIEKDIKSKRRKLPLFIVAVSS